MRYHYAIVDDIGKCFAVYGSTIIINDQYHIPINKISIDYLSKYYYPIPLVVDFGTDFNGEWYLDIAHSIKGVVQ